MNANDALFLAELCAVAAGIILWFIFKKQWMWSLGFSLNFGLVAIQSIFAHESNNLFIALCLASCFVFGRSAIKQMRQADDNIRE